MQFPIFVRKTTADWLLPNRTELGTTSGVRSAFDRGAGILAMYKIAFVYIM